MTFDRSSLPEITPEVCRTWRRTRQDRSAGGVAYQYFPIPQPAPEATEQDHTLKIALIATHGNRRWQLPKGSREAGETSLETAIREVEEETGLSTESMQFLQTIDYWYWDTYQKDVPELVHKLVDFYLLQVTGGELNDSSYEVDDVQWFTPAAALEIMTFRGEKIVVQQAMAILQSLQTNS
jgi:8-oxo-dGTP pyrophosphatase MutT (NUDIX family)